MWWTAITLAAVAAWFEWTYRRSRKAKSEDQKASEKPETPVEEQLEHTEK